MPPSHVIMSRYVIGYKRSLTLLLLLCGGLAMYLTAFSTHKDTREYVPLFQGHPGYDITLVTMYLNLGKFQKGGGNHFYTTEGYLGWMKSWGWLNNTVVAFFDDDKILEVFRKIRSAQPPERTIIHKISRDELPAFKDFDKIKKMFAQPSYPKHYPNTVKAEYSCAVSAKTDVLDKVLTSEKINTKYLAWLDIGYFRLLTYPKFYPANKTYKLEVPEGFKDDTVAFSVVNDHGNALEQKPWDIIRHNMVWVASGLIVGTPKVMQHYVKDFRAARSELLAQNMMSTGQQILASLYSKKMKTQPSIGYSLYSCTEGQFGMYASDRIYFCFGFKCKEAAEIRSGGKNGTVTGTKIPG
ncbi:uncharacterized protein LOC106012666 [Aplysia californica]|uniref:Uncharacterized protein LOC106012666 n=1 Tax=Aplysia californica TaxID=6500 RepID=A0ABM1A6G7_APLCA|nr:uncharacterized protein LOC106012666 [Aplysia californica]